jgi:hypothetical protein
MLRVCGSTRKVRQFLAASSIQPHRVFWKGEPRRPTSRDPIPISGFNIYLSEADDLATQAAQAVKFIRRHKQDFLLIPKLRFLAVVIDFGLYDLATEDRPWPSYEVPHPLVSVANELGCSIELSFYGTPPDTPQIT